MLQPLRHVLSSKRIILASSSPRRKQILENIGLDVEVVASNFEENLDKTAFSTPSDYAVQNALLKTVYVAQQLMNDKVQPYLVIGADTVVTLNNEIYEKPTDKADAFRMLSEFSGRTHTVYTGVVIVAPKPGVEVVSAEHAEKFHVDKFYAATEVEFDDLSSEIINAYIETGEPLDKAGGYGIQALGGTLVKSIYGDYYNVMGFPLNLFARRLTQFLQNCRDELS